MTDQAISDMRVLDLTHYIPGPYCTKLLADYGADVIKVENPGGGDIARKLGPFPDDKPDPEKCGLFLYLNSNKRGITLNLKTTEGAGIFKELVKWAGVVVESFRPGVMLNFGLDYEALTRIKSQLVMTSISNFGQTGPYRDFKASEIIIYGMGGAMLMSGQSDRYPLKLGGTVTLLQGGGIAALASMSAFYTQCYQKMGQYVDISLFETAAGSIDRRTTNLVNYQYTGRVAPREQVGGLGYPYGIYPCADGYIDVASPVTAFSKLAYAIGMPEFAKNPRFSTPEAQTNPKRKEEFERTIFLPWLQKRTRQEAFDAFQQYGVPCGMCQTTEDVVNDLHFKSRGFFKDIDHPQLGPIKFPGAPFQMGETPWQIRRLAPLPGQHNDEVLGGILGYSKKELTRLKEDGVV